MQTGWRHDDHGSQREFERLRNPQGVDGTVRPSDGVQSASPNPQLPDFDGGNPEQPAKRYELSSRLGTVTITSQEGPSYKEWNLERFLTVSVNGLDIYTRLNPIRYDTVKHIDFVAGANITIEGSNFENDRVVLTISGGGAGSYDWDFITDTAVAETVTSGEQLSYVGSGIVTVTNVGNVITFYAPATVGWELQAVGTVGTETIDGGDTVVFDKGGDLTVGRVGNTITYSYTNPNPTVYNFNIQANAGATEQIDTGETVTFAEAGGGITIVRTGNTLTFTVASPIAYTFDLQAVGTVGAETISNGQNIVFDKGGDLTVVRVGDTITYSYTNPNPTPYSFDLKAVGTVGQETIGTGQDIIFDKGGDLAVARVGDTITYSYTNPNPTVYNFLLKAVGTVGFETITTGQDIIFDRTGDLAVTRVGDTITYSYTNPNPTPYNFNIQANGGVSTQIDTGETIDFVEAGGGITIVRTGNTLTFTVSTAGSYSFLLEAVGTAGSETITNGQNIVFDKGGDLTVSRTAETITYSYTNPNPTPYNFNIQANGLASTQIDTGETIDFVEAGGGISIVRSGNTLTFTVSTAGTYSWVASDGPNNLTVATTDEVTWVGASGVIVSLNTGTKTFEIDRPLQIQQDGTPVGLDDTITLNFDNAVGTKPAGHTGRIWTEVFDVGAGVRRTEMWYDPTGTVYTWNIAASGTSSSSAVASGATVTFTGINGIIVTRSGDDITISMNPEDPDYPSDDAVPPLTGFIEFSNTDPDYNGSTPAYMYGTRLYVDVVHNWNLGNMNNVEVHLTDVALDDTPALAHYRDGSVSMAGEDLGDVPFRNFPHWAAIDGDTVRFWATMSLGKPTTMKFYYSMRQV